MKLMTSVFCLLLSSYTAHAKANRLKKLVIQKALLFSAAFLSVTFALGTADALNKYQGQLLDSVQRPTPSQMMARKSNFEGIDYENSRNGSTYMQDIPVLIVALEKAFPGGTYAFLGRDMDLVADAVEAFYLSIGQKERVVRIRISTPSLIGPGATAENITDFLVQSGLNDDPKVEKPPMVLVDFTSFRSNSQSTQIVEAALNELKKRGIPTSQVMKHFNIATINGSPQVKTINPMEMPPFQIADKLEQQSRSWVRNKALSRIISIPVGDIAYHSEWHDKYGPLVRQSDGTVTTAPQAYYQGFMKQAVLNSMLETVQLAISQEFQKRVVDLASKHFVQIEGLKIPYKKPPQRPIPPTAEELAQLAEQKAVELAKIAEQRAEAAKLKAEAAAAREVIAAEKRAIRGAQVEEQFLKHLENKLELEHRDKSYRSWYYVDGYSVVMSYNAQYVHKHLTKNPFPASTHYFELSLNELLQYYNSRRISVEDFRLVFFSLLAQVKIYDMDFVRNFQSKYSRISVIKEAMSHSTYENSNQKYNFVLLKTPLSMSCRKVLVL